MSRVAIVIVLALAGSATAGPHEWTLEAPAGWTEASNADAGIEPMVAQLRGIKSTVDASATVYMAPDGKTQLTILQWSILQVGANAHTLEQLNRGVMEGAKERATAHVSDEAHREGQQLVADQIDLVNGLHTHQHRRFAIDLGGVTHMVSAMCASATVNASCEQAIMRVQLAIPNQVDPDASSDSGNRDPAYRIGQIVGVVVVLLLVGLWLKTGGHVWRRPKKS